MEKSAFVVILRYLVPAQDIDPHRAAHLEFLDKFYAKRVFIGSGKQVPASGGVIIAKAKTRQELVDILRDDPFQKLKLAEYQIFEFIPTRFLPEFKDILDS